MLMQDLCQLFYAAFRCTSVCARQPHPLASENYVDRENIKFSSTCIQPVEVLIQVT